MLVVFQTFFDHNCVRLFPYCIRFIRMPHLAQQSGVVVEDLLQALGVFVLQEKGLNILTGLPVAIFCFGVLRCSFF